MGGTVEPGRMLGHYLLLEKIGEGGMGVVFRAEDTLLKRNIALKLLPVSSGADPVRLRRFQREAEAIAALNHPHIVAIYSIEHAGDLHFLTMELVEGSSLDRVLQPGGCPVGTVLDTGAALADALATAHENGIIHRDLKPANVMITKGGRVKVLDFGLAKLAAKTGRSPTTKDSQAPTRDASLTSERAILGTVPYMSPEQLKGQDLDHRTDLFSLGVILYEMTTGVRPFHGESSAELVSSIMRDCPVPATQVRPELPLGLGQIIGRCLEKEPGDRFQTARHVYDELRRLESEVRTPGMTGAPSSSGTGAVTTPVRWRPWLWAGGGTAVVLTLLAGLWLGRGRSRLETAGSAGAVRTATDSAVSATHPTLASIAVLPFVDMSPEKDQEYFADGLSEELLNALVRLPGLRVAARVSAFSFKGRSPEIAEVGTKLNVATVLQGSVRKSGDSVRITVRLINVSDGFHLWSESYDRRLDDIFEVQDDIARSVADALKIRLLAGTGTAVVRRAKSPQAYNLVLRGRHFRERLGRENLEKAIAAYKEALTIDPAYAPAWAGLSGAYAYLAGGSGTFDEDFRRAREAAVRALQLDPMLAEAHAQIGWIKKSYDWDWTGADEAFQQALALDPENALVISSAATLAAILGRLDEAIALDRKAVDLDPLSPFARTNLALHLWEADHLEEAARAARMVIEISPDFAHGHLNLGLIYLSQGRIEAALEEMRQADPGAFRLYGLALAQHSAGQGMEADAALSELIEEYASGAAVQIAQVHAWRGEAEKAFEWLDRAYVQRDSGLSETLVEPLFRNLKGDPRWRTFLARMRLPPES